VVFLRFTEKHLGWAGRRKAEIASETFLRGEKSVTFPLRNQSGAAVLPYIFINATVGIRDPTFRLEKE
jgi:hypothetical protein